LDKLFLFAKGAGLFLYFSCSHFPNWQNSSIMLTVFVFSRSGATLLFPFRYKILPVFWATPTLFSSSFTFFVFGCVAFFLRLAQNLPRIY